MIPSSELIINPDGSIYHLNLKPGEIAETILTVGDPERVPEVSKYFDSIEIKRSHREIVTQTGYIGKKRVSVISTGMGTDNIDIVLNELDALVNINFETRQVKEKLVSLNIIRLGTSGSLQKDVPLDSVLLSEFALGFDGLLDFYEHDFSSNHELNELTTSTVDFLRANQLPFSIYATAASQQLLSCFDFFPKGITITAPGFYAPQGRQMRLKPSVNNFIDTLSSFRHKSSRFTNLEMETAGIYGLGSVMGHRCLSVNAILANRIENTFSKTPAETVENMLRTVLEKVESL